METKSNSLVYKTNKIVGKEHIYVTISLNDECKNGHQDFSITGSIYETGRPKVDRYHISGGCIHDDIAKHFPQFIPFIKLHLCDYKGIPMHCSANGFYHLKNGFNSKSTGEAFKKEYCEYYRVSPQQFDILNETHSETHFAITLEKIGVFEQWEREANEAIKVLENLTETDFIVDSAKTQYYRPSDEKMKEETERIKNGYYSPEQREERRLKSMEEEIANMKAYTEAKISELQTDLDLHIQAFKIGGKKAKEQIIFYKHTKRVKINWRDDDKLPGEMVEKLKKEMILPEGVSFDN